MGDGASALVQPVRSGITSLCVVFPAGVRCETEAEHGTAHFLEHMFFKGTMKRSLSALFREAEAKGIVLEARTERELTAYKATSLNKHAGASMNLIADMLANSQFAPDLVEAEKETILEEQRRTYWDHQNVLMDGAHEMCFRGDAMARSVLGTSAHISGMTRDRLVAYRNRWYTPRAALISVAGGAFASPEEGYAMIEREMGPFLALKAPDADASLAAGNLVPELDFHGGERRVFVVNDAPHVAFKLCMRSDGYAGDVIKTMCAVHAMGKQLADDPVLMEQMLDGAVNVSAVPYAQHTLALCQGHAPLPAIDAYLKRVAAVLGRFAYGEVCDSDALEWAKMSVKTEWADARATAAGRADADAVDIVGARLAVACSGTSPAYAQHPTSFALINERLDSIGPAELQDAVRKMLESMSVAFCAAPHMLSIGGWDDAVPLPETLIAHAQDENAIHA